MTTSPSPEAAAWARTSQSPVYIRKVKRLSRLIKGFLPSRFSPKDDPKVSQADYRWILHGMLSQPQDDHEGRRRGRRAAGDPVSGS